MTDRIIPYFNFYATDFKALKDKLSKDDLWDIVNAMCDICLYSETEFKPNNKFQETYYNKILDNFEPCRKRYLSCVINGGKGGRPHKENNPQDNPQDNPRGNQDKTRQDKIIQDKKEISIADAKEKSKRFIPPTIEEIKKYISENNLSIDGDYFLKYFTTGNWVDSKGNKVKNWKQKLLTWDKSGINNRKSNGTFTNLSDSYGKDVPL